MFRQAILLGIVLCLVGPVSADVQFYLSDVPDYRWYHGCSPTSGGALIGYWDNQPGYENLYYETAPLYAGSGKDPIDEIIASDEHINSTYVPDECTHDNSPPPDDQGPNSIACFMHTTLDGSSTEWNIATGMRRYAAYDDPDTTVDESYAFHSLVHYAPLQSEPDWFNEGGFTFEDLEREVKGGRPVLLNCSLDGGGHTVLAYGYWVDDNGDEWFAVRDTWQDGNSNGVYGVTATTDNGQEWWKFELQQPGDSFGNAYYLDDAVYFAPNRDGVMEEQDDFGDTFTTAELVDSLAETLHAELTADDWDYYMIWLDSGDRIVAMTQDNEGFSGSIDTVLYLINPDGTAIVGSNDFWGSDTNISYLQYRADMSGYWRVAVTGDNGATGEYYLTLLRQGELGTTEFDPPAPEPSTVALFSLGAIVAAGGLRRRKRKAAQARSSKGKVF